MSRAETMKYFMSKKELNRDLPSLCKELHITREQLESLMNGYGASVLLTTIAGYENVRQLGAYSFDAVCKKELEDLNGATAGTLAHNFVKAHNCNNYAEQVGICFDNIVEGAKTHKALEHLDNYDKIRNNYRVLGLSVSIHDIKPKDSVM